MDEKVSIMTDLLRARENINGQKKESERNSEEQGYCSSMIQDNAITRGDKNLSGIICRITELESTSMQDKDGDSTGFL